MPKTKARLLVGLRNGAWLLLIFTLFGLLWIIGSLLFLDPPRSARFDEPASSALMSENPAAASPRIAPNQRESLPNVAGAPDTPQCSIASATESTVQVQVVDAQTGIGIPSADLWYLYYDGILDELKVDSSYAETKRRGHHLVADPQGILKVPYLGPKTLYIVAESSGLRGQLTLHPQVDGPQPSRVLVYRNWDLNVVVLNEKGDPVTAVPVACEMHKGTSSWTDMQATDDQGRVLFKNIGIALGGPFCFARVGLPIPASGQTWHVLRSNIPPDEPIQFVLPGLGSVEVFVEEGGHAVATHTMIRLCSAGSSGSATIVRPGLGCESALASKGHHIFPLVGINCDLDLQVFDMEANLLAQRSLRGPRFKGEKIVFTVDIPGRRKLVLRAIDLEGRALSRSRVKVCLVEHSDARSLRRECIRSTDADGLFTVVLSPDGPRGTCSVIVECVRKSWQPPLMGQLDISEASWTAPGRADVLDVHLLEPPVLARGRVIDFNGVPLHGACVEIVQSSGELSYQYKCITDTKGAFVLRGLCQGSRLSVTATHEEHAKAELLVFRGDTSVEIPMAAAGGLAGFVVCDQVVPADRLRVSLKLPLGDDRISTEVDNNGAFAFDGLAAGKYALDLLIGGGGVVHHCSDLNVEPGECLRDPRIQGIDLRNRLRAIELQLGTEDSAAEIEGVLLYRDARLKAAQEYEVPFWGTPLTIVTAMDCLNVTVSAKGYHLENIDVLCGHSASIVLVRK